ncbi:hypothetical protein C8J56DRAFT_1053084 [Mycena floridula]|nr:hypothetical protein C8J56DRAFT_1053084 [Mycena floridula]
MLFQIFWAEGRFTVTRDDPPGMVIIVRPPVYWFSEYRGESKSEGFVEADEISVDSKTVQDFSVTLDEPTVSTNSSFHLTRFILFVHRSRIFVPPVPGDSDLSKDRKILKKDLEKADRIHYRNLGAPVQVELSGELHQAAQASDIQHLVFIKFGWSNVTESNMLNHWPIHDGRARRTEYLLPFVGMAVSLREAPIIVNDNEDHCYELGGNGAGRGDVT